MAQGSEDFTAAQAGPKDVIILSCLNGTDTHRDPAERYCGPKPASLERLDSLQTPPYEKSRLPAIVNMSTGLFSRGAKGLCRHLVVAGVIMMAIQIGVAVDNPRPENGTVALQDPERLLLDGKLGFKDLILVQRKELNPSHVYTYHAEGLSAGGGLYRYNLAERKLTQLVDASQGVILDAQVSYDGSQILFSWKKTMSEPFQIHRIHADGTGLVPISTEACNNMNPCWLPDGGIAFLSDRKPAFAYCWITTSPVLYRSDADGSNVIRLSANYLNDFTPSIMDDGRIMFSRWEYVDRPAIPIQSVWAINPDGTGLSGIFGNRVLCPATFMETRTIPNTQGKLLCVMTSHNGPCRGAIGMIDLSQGGNAQEAIRNLTPDVKVGPINDAGAGNSLRGPYESPFPINERFYFVSKAGQVLFRDYDGTCDVEILKPAGDGLGYYSPQPLVGRPLPVSLRPMLAKSGPQEPWASVVLHDVYLGLEPKIQRGSIKRIAVVQEMEKSKLSHVDQRAFGFQFPVVSCGATYAPKRVWGFADVEADGSAHFKVPAGVPIYFLPLDAAGRAVQRMRTFTHFMPGERQSCTGCHADRNYATASPAAARPSASLHAAQELQEPDWGVTGFSYPRIVQPVLDRHCVECHDARSSLDLSGDRTDFFNVSYENLARAKTGAESGRDHNGNMANFGRNPYTSWIPSFNGTESNILDIQPGTWGSPVSKLAEVVISGHRTTNGTARVKLTLAEQQRILMWIDLNVPFYGTSQSRQPLLQGCRRILPQGLDVALDEIGKRRCASCHSSGVPRSFFVRLDHPSSNRFLLAPLAKQAGGLGVCGDGGFTTSADPDYQAILKTFAGVDEQLSNRIDEDYN